MDQLTHRRTNGRTDRRTDGRMDGRMDGPADGPTDRRTYGQMDKPSYRDAWTHLEMERQTQTNRQTQVKRQKHVMFASLKKSLVLWQTDRQTDRDR